ncbi:MAG: hypothetical protein LKF76_01560 [Eggerthellaceae bacterium]|jgi:hypothetical protein|nr:hypothetical protein [Eggerthellaceae bacterium]
MDNENHYIVCGSNVLKPDCSRYRNENEHIIAFPQISQKDDDLPADTSATTKLSANSLASSHEIDKEQKDCNKHVSTYNSHALHAAPSNILVIALIQTLGGYIKEKAAAYFERLHDDLICSSKDQALHGTQFAPCATWKVALPSCLMISACILALSFAAC